MEKIILNPEARRVIIEICVNAKLRALKKEKREEASEKTNKDELE
jgi:hypothetical protein